MPKRYTVAHSDERPVEFVYPADAVSLQTIRSCGGLSKMSAEDKAKLKFKTVHAGDDCSDMPESALTIYLERGWVIEETPKATPKPPAATSKVVVQSEGEVK